MKLKSQVREEEYATEGSQDNTIMDRDIKRALLIEKISKFSAVPVKGTYHGHKVHFSDVRYMQAI